MQLYDGESPVYWASIGLKTKQEMEGIPQLEQMLSRPSVLYDDGLGMVYDWRLLSVLCGEWGVKETGDSAADFAALEKAMQKPRLTAEQELQAQLDALAGLENGNEQ